jgi:adenylyltransferase/sulfurtransferase
MSKQKFLERYSRQIILKDIGILGQKLISKTKILVVGAGGLGCPIAEYLSRAGIGTLGIVDFDKVQLSNIHRQSMYNTKDIGKFKVDVVQKKIKLINPLVKIKKIRKKINEKNIKNIVSKFDIIVDGSDNFKTKFLLNKYSIKFKKFYISGAISKFDGHIFTFNFKNKNEPCLRCFYQTEPSDDILNCETEGILGPVAAVVANIQANEVIKKILNIGNNLKNHILIVNLKNLNFRKVKFNKKRNCICA